MFPRIAGRPAAVCAQLWQVVDWAMCTVRLQEIIIHHLGIVLDHIQAGMPPQCLQLRLGHASAQRQNQERPPECLTSGAKLAAVEINSSARVYGAGT